MASWEAQNKWRQILTLLLADKSRPLSDASNVEVLLQLAKEVEAEDPKISRILYHQAYELSHSLDPLVQFKIGLHVILQQKFATVPESPSEQIESLCHFYDSYQKKHRWVEDSALRMKWLQRVLQVIKDLILTLLTKHPSVRFSSKCQKIMGLDTPPPEPLGKPYNIVPLEAPFPHLPEVEAAILELEYIGTSQLPGDLNYDMSKRPDVFDVLGYIFGFQVDNVRNQREHLVLLLANAQSHLGRFQEIQLILDAECINMTYEKLLNNYESWCSYLREPSCRSIVDSYHDPRKMKLFLMALYLLIWGEAANARFLPECLCFIFHKMAAEFEDIFVKKQLIDRAISCREDNNSSSFLNKIIQPLYHSLKAEADKSNGGKASYSKWRNYDDFNEFFWSESFLKYLEWPWHKESAFLQVDFKKGKVSFVEYRTFLHLYHSFHRLWILLVMMLQALTIVAFSSSFGVDTFMILMSLGLTYFSMNLLKCVLDVFLMYGAYTSSRGFAIEHIFVHLIFFGSCTGGLLFLYLRMWDNGDLDSFYAKLYMLALGSYMALQFMMSSAKLVPRLRNLAGICYKRIIFEWIAWLFQEHHYVGRGLIERRRDFLRYFLFWIVIFGCKFVVSYFFQIKPLVPATTMIVSGTITIQYTWHDFVSASNHNALAVFFLWSPVVLVYFLDISIWYSVFSAILGGLIGARERLGEIHSLEMFKNRFDTFPEAFVEKLQCDTIVRSRFEGSKETNLVKQKEEAERFAHFWNKIIQLLREEDYISYHEHKLLLMPSQETEFPFVKWPLFLLIGKVHLAVDLANESKEMPQELQNKISNDHYMRSAVKEVHMTLYKLLQLVLQGKGQNWLQNVMDTINSVALEDFLERFDAFKAKEILNKSATLADYFIKDKVEEYESKIVQTLRELIRAIDNFVFYSAHTAEVLEWINSDQLKSPIFMHQKQSLERLHAVSNVSLSAADIPKNLEARRRLEFFTNSLFMKIPKAASTRSMKSFSVYTPFYKETVLFSKEELLKENEDGITILFYLQKIFPDEWRNLWERIGKQEQKLEAYLEKDDPLVVRELRLWASYRGQTLARTVRGMMYYREAVIQQSLIELANGVKHELHMASFEAQERFAKAQADLKFTYVVTCQLYGQMKAESNEQSKNIVKDIQRLMAEYESLRIAYIDIVESDNTKGEKEYYSKLVKHDGYGKDQVIYSIKLPGDPIIGEGKPENQNHAIIFTRGEALQAIDMNQDNYFEEALKMRNLLEEFDKDHGIHKPTILGVREHVFTGSVSSLAWFMSNQETSFVTLGQRVMAKPLKVRMHYGHPDVFDRIFHLTRGGISKASKGINISEDIFSGINSILRKGNITHHEYIQVGKGRDVGLNQISLFEGKVSGGNGEQTLSRDVYRLGQLFDFFRMVSFYVTSVGYYISTLITVIVVYIFLYGKAYLALSGVGASLENSAIITSNQALQSALDTQFIFQIGMLTAIPMLVGLILEQGILMAIVSFITMQLQLCSVFFTFSLGTRSHYFGRSILHGGARYRGTGRGFVVRHIKFAENYRTYARSHFVKALEIVMLLLVFLAYGNNNSSITYLLLSFSSWFLAISWLFAPFVFNPSGFEWPKTVDDFDDWTSWLFYSGGVGVKGDQSWEAWWEEEQEHIRSLRGRILETILSSRFLLFQYGVVYHLKAASGNTSLAVYGASWLVLIGIVLIFMVFSLSDKAPVDFQTIIRFLQGFIFIMLVVGVILVVQFTAVTVGDIFASLLALIPTGWGLLSIGIAWKGVMKQVGLWRSLRAIAWFYDAAMGTLIFLPISVLSWFPFISTFQTRLLFNQAFSRGLEISLILAGRSPSYQD